MSSEQEAIARRIDEYLSLLRQPTDDEYPQRFHFQYIRSLCRARDCGRMTQDQKRRLQGILRNFRRTVIEARRMGRYVPPIVLQAVEKFE